MVTSPLAKEWLVWKAQLLSMGLTLCSTLLLHFGVIWTRAQWDQSPTKYTPTKPVSHYYTESANTSDKESKTNSVVRGCWQQNGTVFRVQVRCNYDILYSNDSAVLKNQDMEIWGWCKGLLLTQPTHQDELKFTSMGNGEPCVMISLILWMPMWLASNWALKGPWASGRVLVQG